MHKSNQEDVVLYTRTLILPRKDQPLRIKEPCLKCQSIRDKNDGLASASNNSSILVNTFDNVSDRSRFASFIGLKIFTDST